MSRKDGSLKLNDPFGVGMIDGEVDNRSDPDPVMVKVTVATRTSDFTRYARIA